MAEKIVVSGDLTMYDYKDGNVEIHSKYVADPGIVSVLRDELTPLIDALIRVRDGQVKP